jgi:hypothetical protein
MALGGLSDDAEVRHRRGGLNEDDAAEDEVPEAEGAAKAGLGDG